MTTCKEALQRLPSKRKPTLKDQIRDHLDDINDARSRGYNYRELVNLMRDHGIEIACSTLKKYVQQLNKAARQQTQPNVFTLPKARR